MQVAPCPPANMILTAARYSRTPVHAGAQNIDAVLGPTRVAASHVLLWCRLHSERCRLACRKAQGGCKQQRCVVPMPQQWLSVQGGLQEHVLAAGEQHK